MNKQDYIEELNLSDDIVIKDIDGFDNQYVITNTGRVFRRINRNTDHRHRPNHWKEIKGCEKTDKRGNKFIDFQLNSSTEKKRNVRQSRLMKDYFDVKIERNTSLYLEELKIHESTKNKELEVESDDVPFEIELFEDEIIKNFLPQYYITNYGRVFKLNEDSIEEVELSSDKYGYKRIIVFGGPIAIHRVVATYFVYNPDPKNFNTVDHINNDNTYNYYKNLQWCSSKWNVSKYFNECEYKGRAGRRKIKVINVKTNEENIYNSIRECHDLTGVSKKLIAYCLDHKDDNVTKNLMFTEIID